MYMATDGLGFSLKPPKWLRKAVGKVVGTIFPSGPPEVVVLPPPPSPLRAPTPQTPLGSTTGLLTLGAIGVGALVLGTMMGRRR